MASEKIFTVTDDNFEKEVRASTQPVILDFWAPWCGPCRTQAPILEDIAAKYEGRIKVAKMNVDENTKTAAEFSIASIPTLIFFKEGKAVETVIGLSSKDRLEKATEKIL